MDRQNVIVVHNHYQRPGGEDQVVRAEVALLQSFGHETQLFLGRGEGVIKTLKLNKIVRVSGIPFSFGFPFGLSMAVPPNLPLPSKIVTSVLDPIDPTEGDIKTVDAKVRAVMQAELDVLASQRRFPVIG